MRPTTAWLLIFLLLLPALAGTPARPAERRRDAVFWRGRGRRGQRRRAGDRLLGQP